MSRFGSMLLFDLSDPPIENWTEDLGSRGVYDKWNLKNTSIFLRVDEDNDPPQEDSFEVWIGENDTGKQDSLFFGKWSEAIEFAKGFMERNKDAKAWGDLNV
jgi:hypothetical protein